MAVLAIIVLIIGAMTSARAEPFDETIGRGYNYVVTDGIYGIIIDEAFAPRFVSERHREEVDDYWTPTREDIVRAEELVRRERGTDREADRERAQEHHADRLAIGGKDAIDDAVSRQYHGVIVNDTRLLHINAMLRGLPSNPLAPVVVADGGPGYWTATVDAERWTVESYVENGQA